MIKELTCKDCGKTFSGYHTKIYCDECIYYRIRDEKNRRAKMGSNRKLGSIDNCVICGKEYVVKSGLQKYCPDCKEEQYLKVDRKGGLKYYHDNKDDINPPRYEKRRVEEIRLCAWCGKEFKHNGKPMTFCSSDCKRQSLNARYRIDEYKTCVWCGKQFKHNGTRKNTCSYECKRNHINKQTRDRLKAENKFDKSQ